ncbi:MAG: efflux RND transporter periplasmic adaptor subunit [Polyangiaceae bacterium]|nr:efflux RND transporter periplasmic adaptor subunit [Polyangiaceae bacterium]
MSRLALVLASLVSLAAGGCRVEHQAHAEAAKLQVTTPLRKDAELTKEFVAQVRAIQHIEVRALEKGYLTGVYIDEGQHVAKGTKLFQVMPMIYQAEVQKAAAEAQLSDIEVRNTKLLADKKVVSPNELALAQAKLARAKAEVSLAATHKSLTALQAPFDGLIGRFRVRLGSLVDEGDLLTTLSDNSKVWVYFNVSEAEYLAYKHEHGDDKPAEVKLVMANGQLFDQPGVVETIEADFNNETGNLAFRATFVNPKGLLRHGETGKVVMTVPHKNALLIPQKATFDVLDKKFVFVVDDKDVVHSRPITVAAELPQVFVVESGVAENERILIDGLRKVRDGAHIGVDFRQPADVFAHLEVPAE